MAGQPGGHMPMQGMQEQPAGDWSGQDYPGPDYRKSSGLLFTDRTVMHQWTSASKPPPIPQISYGVIDLD